MGELAGDRGFEPLPPHATDAEESLLGALLIDPEAIELIEPSVRPEDFYHPRNRDIYGAMTGLHARGAPTDYVMVCDELERVGLLDRVGGQGYLSRLLTVVPTSIHAEHYAAVVARTALSRRLIGAGGAIARIGYEDTADGEAALSEAQDALRSVARGERGQHFEHIGGILTAYLEAIQTDPAAEPGPAGRIMSGFTDVDRLLGGFARSDLVIIAARPSLGKTALALNIARNVALHDRATVGVFSVEMSKWQIAQRLLCAEAEIDSARLREAHLGPAEIGRLAAALDELSGTAIYVDDSPNILLAELRSRAREFAQANPVDLLIVDHLQLVRGGRGRGNRVEEISEVSRELKGLARELNCPVLALSQLSRAVESRPSHIPMLSDLRDSGSIEQDADVVAFIYRDDVYDKQTPRRGVADIIVAKHRNGPVGMASLLFQERLGRFLTMGWAQHPEEPDPELHEWPTR